MIKIQKKNFSSDAVIKRFLNNNDGIGAIVSFTGYVRDFMHISNKKSTKLFIEHYEGMTKKEIEKIISKAKKKWNIYHVNVIHRIGTLDIGEQIVFVVVSSKHRDDAFQACKFIIDFLKTDAPFWKKEISSRDSLWVDQKDSDLIVRNSYN